MEIINRNYEWFFWYAAGLVIGLIIGIILLSGIRKYYIHILSKKINN
jgi:uncharacterized protein YacL